MPGDRQIAQVLDVQGPETAMSQPGRVLDHQRGFFDQLLAYRARHEGRYAKKAVMESAMTDTDKSTEQLLAELVALRQRVAALEGVATE